MSLQIGPFEIIKPVDSGNSKISLHLEPGADHEYIWGPDRPEAITGWRAIINFVNAS